MPQFFPWWASLTHFLNLFFLLLLARSGLESLSAFAKFYWFDYCPPGREWLQLSKKTYGADSRKLRSSLDEDESWSPVIALPGKRNLGFGRHWHFMSAQFWVVTGTFYLVKITELVKPKDNVKHIVFYALDDKGLTGCEGRYGFFDGTIPLHLATNPQPILALETNGAPLPVAHGAPVRVRLETQLGFKMVKWVGAVEFVEDTRDIGDDTHNAQ